MLIHTQLSLFILLATTVFSYAHTHKVQANGNSPAVEYDYTLSDAKDCCNNGDCRPAARHYSDGEYHWFYVEPKPDEKAAGRTAQWVRVPVGDVKPNDLFGDGIAHWCGDLYEKSYATKCAFVPPKREMTRAD